MDHADVDSSHSARIKVVFLHRHGGGDRHPQVTCVVKQRDRPHSLDRVGNGASQSNP
jgi:hypothetical protein